MTILIVGATGNTGKLLVEQLLIRGEKVRVIARSPQKFSEGIRNHNNLFIIHASILELTDTELSHHVQDCTAVASCLGHTISWKGIFGQPRRLVTNATRNLCHAITQNESTVTVKFVLMNTSGNSNRNLNEPISTAQKLIIWLLRLLIPPHADNEQAADYLRTQIGQNNNLIEWVVIRPDNLINQDFVTDYEIHTSPIRSAIFDAGSTSRINVSHFMTELIINSNLWQQWKGQMPVIYNKAS